MNRLRNFRRWQIATVITVLAAMLYNSWPLGFFLNPKVSYGGGLASDLESSHQPYGWVFVALDIITGALVLVAVAVLWRRRPTRNETIILASFALFGIFTIADALLPIPCEPTLTICVGWTHQPMILLHGAVSVGAALFLFVSAMAAWYRRRVWHTPVTTRFIMLGWLMTGVLSVVFFVTPGPGYVSQDYYLIICGIWIALIPLMLHTLRHDSLARVPAEARVDNRLLP